MKRRGLFAAAWAAVAALVLKKTEQPVQARTQGSAILAGLLNTETAGTNVKWVGGPVSSTVVLLGNDSDYVPTDAGYPAAVAGWAAGTGGTYAGVPHGVYGYTERTGGNGVVGVGGASTGGGHGVVGLTFTATGYGVQGLSYAGAGGVRGEIPAGSAHNGIAIYALNNSSYAGPGPGAGGFGIYGLSAKGHGLVGATAAAGGGAVVGATNGVAGAYAGVFYGPVLVSGSLTVFGAKSAAVPHSDGSHRLVYCVESPESWFEDFGKGQLDCGQADVKIDPNFAAIADMDDYHVFLTQYGGHNDLCVTEQTQEGFRVKAKDGTSAGRFSWRIVGKRKDIACERLAKVSPPPELHLPPMPDNDPAATTPRGAQGAFLKQRMG
jgi:hypothetical protein